MTFLSSPLNRALLLIALAVVIALLAYFWIIQPQMQQYDASKQRLAQDIQTYNDLKRVADQKPVYVALTKQIQSRLSGVELTADPRVYIPSYLKQIEDLAKRDGLEVTAVTPQAVPSPSPTASAAPGTSPNPGQLSNLPGIAPAQRAFRSSTAQTNATNNVAQETGATPIPGAPSATGGRTPGGPVAKTRASSARANAIAYLNQSFTQVPINMELAGTYSQLEQFLRDLNKFPKLIGVGNLTMSPGAHSGVGETPTLTIVLPIVAYRLSPSTSGNAQPAPAATPAAAGAGNGG